MKTRRPATALLLSLAALFATTPTAEAKTVTWAVQGVVSEVSDYWNRLGGAIAVGDAIGGTATFDDALPDSNPFPRTAHYAHHSSPFGLALQVSGLQVVSDTSDPNFYVQVYNDVCDFNNLNCRDGFTFIAYHLQPLATGMLLNYAFVELEDSTHSVFADTSLPSSPPNPADFDTRRSISFMGCAPKPEDGCTEFVVRATITSIEAVPDSPGAPLPLPSTALLLALGLPLAWRFKRSS